jgi:hypothetical protein
MDALKHLGKTEKQTIQTQGKTLSTSIISLM